MTERLSVSYSHKISQKLGDDYDTTSLGGEWGFDIPEGADVDKEYAKAYAVLRTIVDGYLETKPKPVPSVPVAALQSEQNRNPTALPGEKITGGSSWTQPPEEAPAPVQVEEGKQFEFVNQKVWDVKVERSRNDKEYAVVRIGSKGGPIPPKGYARVKSYNGYMVSRLKALKEGDLVDVTGVFEGWDGREGRQYDFVPSSVERVRDVRTG